MRFPYLLQLVEGYVFPQRLYPRTAAGDKGKTFIRFNNKYVFIDLFRICQGLWKFSRKFFAGRVAGKEGVGAVHCGGGGICARSVPMLGDGTCETCSALKPAKPVEPACINILYSLLGGALPSTSKGPAPAAGRAPYPYQSLTITSCPYQSLTITSCYQLPSTVSMCYQL